MSTGKEARRQIFNTLNEYKIIIAIAIPAMIGIAVGVTFLMTSSQRKTEKAWSKLWLAAQEQEITIKTKPEEKDKAISKAIKEYNNVINNMDAGNVTPWALYQLGNTYYSTGQYEEAIKTYTQFLSGYKSHYVAPFVKQSIAYAHEERGEFQKAIDQLKDITRDVLSTQNNLDLGRCYEKLGMTQPAIEAYNKVLELETDEKNEWVKLAQYRLDVLK